MGGKNCVVLACRKIKVQPGELQTFHRLPTRNNGESNEKWLQFLKLTNGNHNMPVTVFVCSRHFEKQCFNNLEKGRKILAVGFPNWSFNKYGHPHMVHCTNQRLLPSPEIVISIPNEPKPVENMEVDNFQPEIVTNNVESMEAASLIEPLVSGEELHQTNPLSKELQNKKGQLKAVSKPKDTVVILRSRVRSLKRKNTNLFTNLKTSAAVIKGLEKEIKDLKIQVKTLELSATKTKQSIKHGNEILSQIIERGKFGSKSTTPYPQFTREFSVHLNFLSPKAYDFVRDRFDDALPHPKTLQVWLKPIKISPGFLKPTVDYLVKLTNETERELVFGLQVDEIHIRKQFVFDGEKQRGYLEYGDFYKEKKNTQASAALFVYIVGVNHSFKAPLAYIFTSGLPAALLKAVVHQSCELLHKLKITVISLTFDGLGANFKACEEMNAHLNPSHDNFRPFFDHPISGCPVFCWPDPPHMLKLVRNALADYKIFIDHNGKKIEWAYFEQLAKYQHEIGLRLANKITTRHVHFRNQKMKVKLATQLLSNSVGCSLELLEAWKVEGFEDAQATAEFCYRMNKLFDCLNSHATGNFGKSILKDSNRKYWQKVFDDAKELITGLKTTTGQRLIDSDRCTAFRGLLITIKVAELIMEGIVQGNLPMSYIALYRLCQDHIEHFFSAVRSRFGWNNNPNVIQLEGAIRRILAVKLRPNALGNCSIIEDDTQPQICPLGGKIQQANPAETPEIVTEANIVDECKSLPEFSAMSHVISNVVTYISGFVGRKLMAKSKCAVCSSSLMNLEHDDSIQPLRSDYALIDKKNNGGLFIPSRDLISVCKYTEFYIKYFETKGVEFLTTQNICKETLKVVLSTNTFSSLRETTNSKHTLFGGHVFDLIKSIILEYTCIRLRHIAKESTLNKLPTTIRSKETKLVIFRGQ